MLIYLSWCWCPTQGKLAKSKHVSNDVKPQIFSGLVIIGLHRGHYALVIQQQKNIQQSLGKVRIRKQFPKNLWRHLLPLIDRWKGSECANHHPKSQINHIIIIRTTINAITIIISIIIPTITITITNYHLEASSLWAEQELCELFSEETFVPNHSFEAGIRFLELVHVVPDRQ